MTLTVIEMSNAYYNKSETVEWGTPQQFFDNMNKRFGPFTLDAAASHKNHKCKHYFTKSDDALSRRWIKPIVTSNHTNIVWCNPPYGHGVGKWVEKAVEQVSLGHCQRVVMLLRSTTDVKWFHDWAWPYCSEMIFVKGRMCFDKGDGESKPAVFPSIVLVFDNGYSGMHVRSERNIRVTMQTPPNISRVDINGEEIE